MLNQAESSRRRELQRRAFAAGGGVSEAELAELRELDARAAAASVIPPPPAATGAGPASSAEPSREQPAEPRRDAAAPASDPAAANRADEHESSAPGDEAAPTRRRPRISVLVLSTLIALLLGFGGAWMLLSRDDNPAMTAEQAKAMAEIEKAARFDPGSVVYLGEKYDASVWRATSEDGEKACLAMRIGDRHEYQCVPPPPDELVFAQPVGVSLSHSDDDGDWSYWATLVSDINGREALIIQRHDMSTDFGWEAQYTDEELRQIRMLEAEGIVPNYLQVIGYDGDVPIFISQDVRTCIYVVDPATDAVVQSCDPADDGLYLLQVQDARYEVRETSTRGPMLTIVRNGG